MPAPGAPYEYIGTRLVQMQYTPAAQRVGEHNVRNLCYSSQNVLLAQERPRGDEVSLTGYSRMFMTFA